LEIRRVSKGSCRMPVILLRLSEMDKRTNGRPRKCPHCGSQVLQRWGRVTRSVKDQRDLRAVIYRYRCWECKRTFRDYPESVDGSYYTLRIRQLAALIQTLGLSYRDVATLFSKLGVNLSRMTIWRESQALADRSSESDLDLEGKYFIDKEFVPNVSPKFGVILALDLGRGNRAILGTLNEHNPFEVLSWIKPILEDMGVEVLLIETGYLKDIPVVSAGLH
ncbi:MAG: hypothetical protein PVG32_20380, partial [Anaerolineales bacterium]